MALSYGANELGERLLSLGQESMVQSVAILSRLAGIAVPVLGAVFIAMVSVTMLSVAYGEIAGPLEETGGLKYALSL